MTEGLDGDVVYKYPLSFDEEGTWVPYGLVVLIDTQDGSNVTAWIQHGREAVWEEQRLFIAGTGHPVSELASHVGSVICGIFVWHVFREGYRVAPS